MKREPECNRCKEVQLQINYYFVALKLIWRRRRRRGDILGKKITVRVAEEKVSNNQEMQC